MARPKADVNRKLWNKILYSLGEYIGVFICFSLTVDRLRALFHSDVNHGIKFRG
jgi:hypothetical protein